MIGVAPVSGFFMLISVADGAGLRDTLKYGAGYNGRLFITEISTIWRIAGAS